jgi:hypothetical protein
MLGCGVPLSFIRVLEKGKLNAEECLINIKSAIAIDNIDGFHSADAHCALAAVQFVIAKKEGYCIESLLELRDSFNKEMALYRKLKPEANKDDLCNQLFMISKGEY